MALLEVDRELLERCLARKPRSWEDFVDRFLGLVVHVVNHSAHARSIALTSEDRDDLCGDVFLELLKNDFAALRSFRGESSLATYLTVVARRVVVRKLMATRSVNSLGDAALREAPAAAHPPEKRISDREEVDRLISGLEGKEAEVVRMYHLEGRSYEEISTQVGVPANSIGPTLSRARSKMRQAT